MAVNIVPAAIFHISETNLRLRLKPFSFKFQTAQCNWRCGQCAKRTDDMNDIYDLNLSNYNLTVLDNH